MWVGLSSEQISRDYRQGNGDREVTSEIWSEEGGSESGSSVSLERFHV